MKKGIRKNTVKKDYEPVVFVNHPIADTEHDVIGFNSQVETLWEAIDDGATMIGIVADYGTGKSSMASLLRKASCERGNPKPIVISMWDSIIQKDGSNEKRNISDLTKSFLFQLANGYKSALGDYVNKSLSKNYGNILFSMSNPCRMLGFGSLAAFFFAMYMMADISGTGVMAYLGDLGKYFVPLVPFIRAMKPISLILSVAVLVCGLKESRVAFSHWKTINKQEIEINDVFDVYRVIAEKITPRREGKRLVFIDDLDRIDDKKLIVAFLKELYRFQESIVSGKEKIVFIVSIKPESQLEGEKVNLVYSKVFDTTLFLKPIHFDDYDAILLRLINSDPAKKCALQELIKADIDTTLPASFKWIKKGTNLTLRDIKDRLNHAISIMVSLKSKSYEGNSAANFMSCTAVAFLESQYPHDYYRLIKNEKSFAQFMKDSYKLVDAANGVEDIFKLVNSFNSSFPNENYSSEFVNDLCGMVVERIFNDDFRMYFYTYPKGSHIKTTEEREICNCLIFPNQYSIPKDLDDGVRRAYVNGKNETILQTLRTLDAFPKIVLRNDFLFCDAVETAFGKAFDTFNRNVIEVVESEENLPSYWARVKCLTGEQREKFVQRSIERIVSFSDVSLIIQKRKEIIGGIGPDVLEYRNLFNGIRNVPQITSEEIENIGDSEISIQLIYIEKIKPEQREYLCAAINAKPLFGHAQVWEKTIAVVKKLLSMCDAVDIGCDILKFLQINRYCDEEMFLAVRNAPVENEKIAEYINLFEPNELPKNYLELIDSIRFAAYLKEETVYALLENNLFLTPIMYYTKCEKLDRINEFLGYRHKILDACTKINEDSSDIVVAFRKHCVLEVKAERLDSLYFEEFPLITVEEYVLFESAMEAIQHINPQAIDENNVDEFIQMLHAREYSPQDTIGLFQYLFDEDTNENCIDNRALVEEIIDNIDFTWFSIGDFTYEQRSKLYCAFAEKYSLGDSLAAMEFSREIGCFIPEVERKISQDDNVTSQYSQLICELDELSDVAQSWLAKNYLIAPLSVRLCEVLFKLEYYADYIIANILRDRKMVMDPRIPFAAYLEVYEKVEEVFDIMADHWDFLEQLQQEANLHELQEDRLLPVFKVRQTERFFSFIISEKTSINLKKTYLEEFGKFREEKDSIAFQKLICKPENIKLVDSIELKERISQQLWETNRAHKGQFTRKWNECWKDKLTQAQPV